MSAFPFGASLFFRQPAALAALVLPLALGAWAWGPWSRFRGHAFYAWPLLLVVLAAAEPVHVGEGASARPILLQDVSGSRGEPGRADDVLWSRVPFAARFAFGAAHGTDVARAMMRAAAHREPGHGDVLVLLSDGRDAAPAAGEVVRDLRAKGWRLVRGASAEMTPTAGASSRRDVAVQEIAAVGAGATAGAPLHLVARLAATIAGRVHVNAVQDGVPVPMPAPFAGGEGQLDAGLTEIPFTLTFPRDRDESVVDVHVAYADEPDAWPGNDRAEATFVAGHPLGVWLVSEEGGRPSRAALGLAALLSRRGFTVTHKTPRQLASALREDLPDVAWLLDVAAGEIPSAAVGRLDTLLREGGGLAVTGGPHAYASGGYAKSALEQLLPVTTDERRRAEEPTLALMLVLDRSGSMAGPKLDLTKEGARAALRLLPMGATFGVVAFDAQPLTLLPLQPVHDRERIEGALERLLASGGTNIAAGLREGIEALRASPAARKHIILLSDGQSAGEGISALVDAARDGGITFSTVAVGEGADQHLLRLIAARGGGRAYFTAVPTMLPRLFASETLTVTRAPTVAPLAPTTVVKPHPVTEGLDPRALPSPRALARTRRRAGTDALLDHAGAPLLTCGSVGLGRSCAFSAELLAPRSARQTSAKPPEDEAARLWEQLARFLARPAPGGAPGLDVEQRSESILVRLTPRVSPPLPGPTWQGPWPVVTLLKPAHGGAEARMPYELLDVGRDATEFTATLPAPRPGEATTVAVWRSADAARKGAAPWRTKRLLVRDEEGPASWEKRPLPDWWTSLPVVTPDDLATIVPKVPPPRRERPLRTPLLVAAAVFLIVAAWPRRGILHPRRTRAPS